MTATVNIQNVSHHFGAFQALDSINLTIPAGSFAVLLGPSGCGKTTLLSILGGFITPGEGSVCLDGKDITNLPPAKRTTTTMFQDYALFPHMNLLENVGFGLRMRGLHKARRHARAYELLTLVGLESSVRQKPHQLSGGQRQRVALARALAVEPDVLLLDEPLGALDLKLRQQMQDELKAIQQRLGTTFIHVTHDQEEAMAVADQIIVMNAGKVEDNGNPESIYLRPRSLFAATFMGDVNLISGQVRKRNDIHLAVDTAMGNLLVPAQADVNNSIKTGDSVSLCFRPEHLACEPDKSTHWLHLGEARIIDDTFFGTHRRCRLRSDNGSNYTANLAQSSSISRGQRTSISLDSRCIVALQSQ